MKRSIKYLVYLFIASMFVSSCYGDKGSYEYKDMEVVEISDITNYYSVILNSTILEIKPTIEGIAEDGLTYEWSIYEIPVSEYGDVNFPATIIGTEKELSWSVNAAPKDYKLRFKATAKDGRFWDKVVDITVGTEYSQGLYIFKEIDGGSDVDIYKWWDNIELKDVFKAANGERISGSPKSFSQLRSYPYIKSAAEGLVLGHFIVPATDQEVNIINTSDFSIHTNDISEKFYDPSLASGLEVEYFTMGEMYQGFIANGKYYGSINSPYVPGDGMYGYHTMVNKDPDIAYEMHPSIAISANGFLAFDNVTNSFISLGSLGDEIVFRAYEPTFTYDHNNLTDLELIYMGDNISGDQMSVLAVMKKSDNSGLKIYELLPENMTTSRWVPRGAPTINIYELPSSHSLNNATKFASNKKGAAAIYYQVGNDIYAYNPASTNEPKKLTFSGIDASAEVTNFGTMFRDLTPHNFNYFYVSTYSGGKYKICMYEIVGGEPVGEPKLTFSGDGKVAKVQFVSSDHSNDDTSWGKYSIEY